MMKRAIPKNYFSLETLRHLIPQQGLSERYLRRATDVTLACKLTHTYGKYHLTMLHRELAMNEEQTTFKQAEQMADTMNQLSIFHFSPSCFLHTHDEYIDECIDIYQEYKQKKGSLTQDEIKRFRSATGRYATAAVKAGVDSVSASIQEIGEELPGLLDEIGGFFKNLGE